MNIDQTLIGMSKKYAIPAARISIFIVFFWFGLLKILALSPAESLVQELFKETINFMSFESFIVAFGFLEMFIGGLFLFPRATRIVIPLLLLHMITTALPLILLPSITWSGFLTPTLVGQYIIKNIVIIAAAIGIAGSLTPIKTKNRT